MRVQIPKALLASLLVGTALALQLFLIPPQHLTTILPIEAMVTLTVIADRASLAHRYPAQRWWWRPRPLRLPRRKRPRK